MSELTQDLLKELFEYRDGNLYWKVRKAWFIEIGDISGHIRKGGYREIQINGKTYLAHRLIYLYHHGYLPEFLDHVDCNKSNDDISNLREATKAQNGMNREKQSHRNGEPCSSKYKGVSYIKRDKKWKSRIHIDGEEKHLGTFDSEIEAAKSYNTSAIEHYGEFAKLNGGWLND